MYISNRVATNSLIVANEEHYQEQCFIACIDHCSNLGIVQVKLVPAFIQRVALAPNFIERSQVRLGGIG